MAVKIWHARECEVKIAADPTITTAAALDTFFSGGTTISGRMKNVTIKQPVSEVDKIDFLGEDANGFQNAEGEEKPYDMAELTGTLVLTGDEEGLELFLPTGTAINSTHTRYRPGTGTRKRPAFLLNLDDSSDEVNMVLDNTWAQIGEVKTTGPDGHLEVEIKAKCLARDCYPLEFKD